MPSASEAETGLPTFCPDRSFSFTFSVTTGPVASNSGLMLLLPVVPRPGRDQFSVAFASPFFARTRTSYWVCGSRPFIVAPLFVPVWVRAVYAVLFAPCLYSR